MLNLTAGQTNNVIIYADTISNDSVSYGDFFLLEFQSTYSKNKVFVVPGVSTRNTRFLKLTFEVTDANIEDPLGGSVWIEFPGNFTYKLYNLISPSLNPANGDLIDEGQMYLDDYNPPEVEFIDYISDNENLLSVVYYSGNPSCVINIYNSPFTVDGFMESECNPLFVDTDGLLFILNNSELNIKQLA